MADPALSATSEEEGYKRQVALLPHSRDLAIALRTEHVRLITHKILEYYAASENKVNFVFPNADDRKAIREVLASKGYASEESKEDPTIIYVMLPARPTTKSVKKKKTTKAKAKPAPAPAPLEERVTATS
jgi:hypothetical protein